MNTLRQFDPPRSLHLTTEWQALTPALRHWVRPLWSAVCDYRAGRKYRFAAMIGPRRVTLWKTFGRSPERGVFIHIDAEPFRLVINMSTETIRLDCHK